MTVLNEVIADEVADNPVSSQKPVRHSLAAIARQLAKQQFRVGPHTVRRLLKRLRYGLTHNQG